MCAFIKTMQDQPDRGRLQIVVQSTLRNIPIENATIRISYSGNPNQIIEEVQTDSSGQTPVLDLPTPPLEYSLTPDSPQPYSEYSLQITAPGYEQTDISGTEILPEETAIQPVQMVPSSNAPELENIVIPAHTLYGDYPPKIAED